ncbi:rod shape-determining protein MreC [Candidatus Parcubacteria bacterium]|nr:rod shape-determining protein MreC [Patescibacteria group bacterium]MBU4380920.1 rod shape-determining protein MreC [Patescibacteria group bacterium]MCG2689438.1 rod shape-determining protein MreC [Candidatus Parcubacteria bacterium]
MAINLEIKYAILSLVILVFGATPIANIARGVFTQISAPFLYGFVSIARATHNEWSFWANLRGIQQNNTVLEDKVAELSEKIVRLSEVTNENNLLRDGLKIKQAVPNLNPVLATVLGFSGGEGFDNGFIVNAGADMGVLVGDIVSYKDIVVGIVLEVISKSSVIEPTTSPNLKIAAKIARTGATGVVSGDFGTQLKITGLLPQDDVVAGDIVATSSLNENIPEGLLLGTIGNVLPNPQAIQKEATVKMLLDLTKLDKLIIWTQP